jgi:hypothetical protein
MPTKGSPIYSVRYVPERAERLEAECARLGIKPADFIRKLLDIALGYERAE